MIDMSLDVDEAPNAANAPAGALRGPAILATDGERLMRFRRHRDEAAFRQVVEAHAGLVWGICWQVLRHREDVEDAFQATFLILARKANTIRAADSAAGWLYRVAFRTALAARQRRRRLGVEPLADDPPGSLEDQLASIERSEQCEALLEELHALADRYRQPLVLCYLEGRSRQEAADELGVTLASVKGRLARGLRLLRTRLASRGTALSAAAALLAAEMTAAEVTACAAPIAQTVALGASFAWPGLAGGAAAGESATTTGVFTLANKGILAMKLAAAAKPAIGLLALGVTAGALALAAGDTPAGDGRGGSGAPVVELIADEEPGAATVAATESVDAAPTIEAEPPASAWTLVPAADDVVTGPPTITPVDQPAALDMAVVAAAQQPEQPIGVGGGSVTFLDDGANVLTLTAQTAQPIAGLPADAPALAPPPVYPTPPVGAPRPFTIPLPAPALASATITTGSSRESVELEIEHWQLKTQGLKKKAAALRLKAQRLKAAGPSSEVEGLEADAESDLTMAEMKLCEARGRQLKDALAHWGELQAATFHDPYANRYQAADVAPPLQHARPATSRAPARPAVPAIPSNPIVPADPAVAASPWNIPAPAVESQPQTYPTPPTAAATPSPAVDGVALAQAVAELRAANARLQKRLDELEASRAPGVTDSGPTPDTE